MKLLFILVGYIIYSKVLAGEIAEQFNQLAQSFCDCIYEPTKEKWDQMLEDMYTYNLELGNLVLKLNEDMGDVVSDAEELYNEGMPKFIELPFSEPDVEKDAGITKAQIQKLHELRDEISNLWEDFAGAFVRKTQTDHF